MTVFYLIRHALHNLGSEALAGRLPGVHLSREGKAQARIVCFMQQLRDTHPGEYVAIVSHSDVLKSAIAYYLGVHLDMFQRIEISPASVSVVAIADYGPWVLCVNNTNELGELPALNSA